MLKIFISLVPSFFVPSLFQTVVGIDIFIVRKYSTFMILIYHTFSTVIGTQKVLEIFPCLQYMFCQIVSHFIVMNFIEYIVDAINLTSIFFISFFVLNISLTVGNIISVFSPAKTCCQVNILRLFAVLPPLYGIILYPMSVYVS